MATKEIVLSESQWAFVRQAIGSQGGYDLPTAMRLYAMYERIVPRHGAIAFSAKERQLVIQALTKPAVPWKTEVYGAIMDSAEAFGWTRPALEDLDDDE